MSKTALLVLTSLTSLRRSPRAGPSAPHERFRGLRGHPGNGIERICREASDSAHPVDQPDLPPRTSLVERREVGPVMQGRLRLVGQE
jgi:hypothetical protein